jgi:hypothetical protein
MINESFKVNALVTGLNSTGDTGPVEAPDQDAGAKPIYTPTPPRQSDRREPRAALPPDAYNQQYNQQFAQTQPPVYYQQQGPAVAARPFLEHNPYQVIHPQSRF